MANPMPNEMRRKYLRFIMATALFIFLTGMAGHHKAKPKFEPLPFFYLHSEVVEIIDLRQPATERIF